MRDAAAPVRSVNEAIATSGTVRNPRFELLVPRAVNWIFADKHVGLVARVRAVGAYPLSAINENLAVVRSAAESGAPVALPISKEAITFGESPVYAATLWPLGNNRPVTPDEMGAVLRGIHDTPPPSGLSDWFDVRHGGSQDSVQRLREWAKPPPEALINECERLSEASRSRLAELLIGAPKVLLHGDGHPGNIIELDGCMVGCDLDEICVGPPEADLSLPIVHSRRYPGADPAAGERLAAAYGRPVNTDLLEAMVHARTVSKVISLGQRWRGGEQPEPGLITSLVQRLEAMANGDRFAELHGEESRCPFAS